MSHPKRKTHAVFDSMAQAAAVLDVDVEKLKQAKREGCDAFRSTRIYRAELEAWLRRRKRKTPPPPTAPHIAGTIAELKRALAGAELAKRVHELHEAQKRLLVRAELELAMGELLFVIARALKPLPEKVAPLLVGRSQPEIIAILTREIQAAKQRIHDDA